MVRKKSSNTGFLDELLSLPKWPVLDERWYVIEHTPAYNTGGYYDQDIPAENKIVSPYYNTREDAEAFMSEHEPDDGNSLHVWKDELVERRYKEWRINCG